MGVMYVLFDTFVLFYFVSFCVALSYLTAHGRVGEVLPCYVMLISIYVPRLSVTYTAQCSAVLAADSDRGHFAAHLSHCIYYSSILP